MTNEKSVAAMAAKIIVQDILQARPVSVRIRQEERLIPWKEGVEALLRDPVGSVEIQHDDGQGFRFRYGPMSLDNPHSTFERSFDGDRLEQLEAKIAGIIRECMTYADSQTTNPAS